jgi:hypothetical protein
MPPLSGDGAWSFRIAFSVLIRKADRVIFPPRRNDAKLFVTSLLFRSKKSVSGCYAGEHNAYKHNLRQVNKVQGFKGSIAPSARVQELFVFGPFEIGIAEGCDDRLKHHGHTDAPMHHTLKMDVVDITLIEGHIELRTDLAARAFCDCQKVNEFLVPVPLETFCNVTHDRYRGTPDLVLQPEIFGKHTLVAHPVDLFDQFPRELPSLYVFKMPDHSSPRVFTFEPLNLRRQPHLNQRRRRV